MHPLPMHTLPMYTLPMYTLPMYPLPIHSYPCTPYQCHENELTQSSSEIKRINLVKSHDNKQPNKIV